MVQSIPASDVVAINPSVIAAAGSSLDLNGLILSAVQTRVPSYTMQSFPDAASVAALFGTGAWESQMATQYFNSYANSHKKPGALYIAQIPWGFSTHAWMRGGDIRAMPMATTSPPANGTLQSYKGTLSITVDGVIHNSSAIDFSATPSFSEAAKLITGAFTDIIPPSQNAGTIQGTFHASIGGHCTASYALVGGVFQLTVSVMQYGHIYTGDTLVGTGIPPGITIINQLSGGTPGGAGNYSLSGPITLAANSPVTVMSTQMVVTSIVSGGVYFPGRFISGTGVPPACYIDSQISATGALVNYGTGTYRLSIPASVPNETVIDHYWPFCWYDTQTGALHFQAPSIGSGPPQAVNPSTISFCTGTLAGPLKLANGYGGVTSQGQNNIPGWGSGIAGYMDGLMNISMNWFSFTTSFTPEGDPTIFTWRQQFANWAGSKGNRFAYVVTDWNQAPTTTNNASGSFGYWLKYQSGVSGVVPIWSANPGQGLIKCGFAMGYAASLDFTQTNGRTVFKFRKAQAGGLVADVVTLTAAQYLRANGYNFYGQWATANDQFIFSADGSISGPFLWFDSYTNQVWMTNELQLNILLQLTQIPSIPYNEEGYSLIKASCLGTINAALNFGAIRPGITLSPAQASAVNNQAGGKIDSVLTISGWYLQVQDAPPAVRQARGSPPMTLWWVDGQSIQQIVLGSVEVQ